MAPRWNAAVLGAIIGAAVPPIIVGNALWLLLNPWLVDMQYALPGFPGDRLGFDDSQRADLAVTGLRSVRPLDEGMALLRAARLPDGTTAFTEREISHMREVRSVITGFIAAWAIAAALGLAAVAALGRISGRGAVRVALARGGVLTCVLIAVIGLAALIDFEGFFGAFHGIFFEGNTWRFDDSDTLLQLYPETFWIVASAVTVALALLQAAALALLWHRSAGATLRPAPPIPAGDPHSHP